MKTVRIEHRYLTSAKAHLYTSKEVKHLYILIPGPDLGGVLDFVGKAVAKSMALPESPLLEIVDIQINDSDRSIE